MARNETLLRGLEPGVSKILEVGPSFSPVAPKRDGWLTTIVDHTERPGRSPNTICFPATPCRESRRSTAFGQTVRSTWFCKTNWALSMRS